TLCRHRDVERIDVPGRHHQWDGLLYRDVALLHHDGRRGGESAGARHLHRALSGRERHDHAVLVHARDVGSERFPGDRHGRGGGAVVLEGARRGARVLGGEQIDGRRLDAQHRRGTGAGRLAREGVRPGGPGWLSGGMRGRRGRGRCGRGGGTAHHLDRGGALASPDPRLDDRDTPAYSRDGAVVVDLGDRDVVGRPDYTCRGNDIADAIEGGGQEPVFLSHLDR